MLHAVSCALRAASPFPAAPSFRPPGHPLAPVSHSPLLVGGRAVTGEWAVRAFLWDRVRAENTARVCWVGFTASVTSRPARPNGSRCYNEAPARAVDTPCRFGGALGNCGCPRAAPSTLCHCASDNSRLAAAPSCTSARAGRFATLEPAQKGDGCTAPRGVPTGPYLRDDKCNFRVRRTPLVELLRVVLCDHLHLRIGEADRLHQTPCDSCECRHDHGRTFAASPRCVVENFATQACREPSANCSVQ